MPRYRVAVACSSPQGETVLTYRMWATSQSAAEFAAVEEAGDKYPEYTDIKPMRTEVLG